MSADSDYDILKMNIRDLTKTLQGRAFIWHVLELCGLNSESFTGDNQTFYLEGKRSIGLAILQVLQDADPKIYPRLILAHNEEDENNA